MVNDPLASIATRTRPGAPTYPTPQHRPSRNTPTPQVKNAAGGYVFTIDPVARLNRFLTLGVDGPTYYTSAKELATDNAKIVYAFADGSVDVEEAHRVLVDAIVEISTQGRAPRQNPALFALAIAASVGSDAERRYALQNLPAVARTATHLFQFLTYAQNFRGWGPAFTKYVAQWYTAKEPGSLAYQLVKYRSREGWTHRDVLRKSHPVKGTLASVLADVLTDGADFYPTETVDVLGRALRLARKGKVADAASLITEIELNGSDHALVHGAIEVENEFRALFDWACGRTPDVDHLPEIVKGFLAVNDPKATVADRRGLVTSYRLPWETLPDDSLTDAATWRALLDAKAVPLTALLRQLPRLTNLGLLTPGTKDNRIAQVTALLTDAEYLHKSRIHPINVLVALRTYASGYSARGSSTWTATQQIVDALDKAFYASFKNVTPTGKRVRYAVDVSGSMGSQVSGLPISCREAAAALSLVLVSTESDYDLVKFTSAGGSWSRRDTGLSPLPISPRMRLDTAVNAAHDSAFGATDCALPMLDATKKHLAFDAFVVLTDNETWFGNTHPFEALKTYRARSGIHDAKLVVVSMTATGTSIADPSDPLQLDVSGFDSTVPNVVSDFIRG